MIASECSPVTYVVRDFSEAEKGVKKLTELLEDAAKVVLHFVEALGPDLREVDFLRAYAASLLTLRADAFSSAGHGGDVGAGAGGGAGRQGVAEDVDLLAPIAHPPKDLQVLVRVVRDCGVVHTELGAIDFRRGHRFLVRRADIEHLIVQGYLEES